MKIAVRTIPENGLDVNQSIEADTLGLDSKEMHIISPLNVRGVVQRVDTDNVLANVNVRGKFSFCCSRCLEPMDREVAEKLVLNYPIDKNTEFIDLSEDIRQETILHYPSVVVCKNDCQGLCPGCGVNLNNETCQCEKKGVNHGITKETTF